MRTERQKTAQTKQAVNGDIVGTQVLILKMGGGGVSSSPKKAFSSKENIAGQQVHEKVVSITGHLEKKRSKPQ